MRSHCLAVLSFLLATVPVIAQTDQPKHLHISKTDGSTEAGWVVSIPAGSSDYFNVRIDTQELVDFSGVSVSVFDFGSLSTFPNVGIYHANLGLDATGNTPDLGAPVALATSPPINSGALNDWQDVALSGNGSGSLHIGIQFPLGDSGLLGVGGDTDSSERGGNSGPGAPDPFDASFFTTNAYSSSAVGPFGSGDWGLSPILDAASIVNASGPLLRLTVDNTQLTGDFERARVAAGDEIGVAIFTRKFASPVLWMLFISWLGAPIQPFGPVLPTVNGGSHRFMRLSGTWPMGAGDLTIPFVAVTAIPGVPGSVRTTNEVTVSSLADPDTGWGRWDDCTYESGWVVQIPTQNSDYFTVGYGAPQDAIEGDLHLAVMDFGGSVSSFPRSGLAPPNLGLDPCGLTPDLANPYSSAPFPFPPLTFGTSCREMVDLDLPRFDPAGDVNSFIQLPPGDPALIAVAADKNGGAHFEHNGWTLNGFSTPANRFSVNWGLRAD